MEFFKRTWAEIDLDALGANAAAIRGLLPDGTQMMAVVKADAYGPGDRMVSRELEGMGVRWFGASNLEEGASLRAAGVQGEILIFGYTPPSMAAELAALNITQAVFNGDYARELNEAAVRAGVRVKGHLKVDTGMGRIGFPCESADEICACCRLPGLEISGIFSHFSSSDDLTPAGQEYTRMQKARFDAVVEGLKRRGIDIPFRHLQNSAGIVSYPECSYEAVRAGVILYGQGLPFLPGHGLPLRPVMSLCSIVAMVKTVKAGTASAIPAPLRPPGKCGWPPSPSATRTATCAPFPTGRTSSSAAGAPGSSATSAWTS